MVHKVLLEVYEGEIRVIKKPKGVRLKIVDRSVSVSNPNIIILSEALDLKNPTFAESMVSHPED